jgi:hypothetical protein
MKVLTIKSLDVLEQAMQTEVHHTFGMEHYTDYVFKPRGDSNYSATIVLEDTSQVISNVKQASVSFPDHDFIVDDLDMEQNSIERYQIKNGELLEQKKSGWDWEKE